jgi:hypothetical protein
VLPEKGYLIPRAAGARNQSMGLAEKLRPANSLGRVVSDSRKRVCGLLRIRRLRFGKPDAIPLGLLLLNGKLKLPIVHVMWGSM